MRVICLLLTAVISLGAATKIASNVIDLNDRFSEVMNDGYWLVKFYAPWCAHCKRLAPVWEHVAHALADMNSPVRVGKVDCTRFTVVANMLRINAYPTIILFRNGVRIPYEGERKKEALIDFTIKSSGPVVVPIETAARLAEMRKTAEKDPFFVFVDADDNDQHPDAATTQLYTQYEAVADSLFTESRFGRTKSVTVFPKSLVVDRRPAIVVFKDGGHTLYDPSDYPDLPVWIEAERWPLMPQATPANIRNLGKSGKKLVLVVSDLLDRHNTTSDVGKFFKVAKTAAQLAKQDKALRDKFQFAWLDGTSIASSIVMGKVNNPDLLVFNESTYEFYLSPDPTENTTPQSIVTFLQTVDTLDPLGGRSASQRLRRIVYDVSTNLYEMFQQQPILTVCLFGVPTGFLAIITYSICSADFSVDRDEIYPEDDDDEDFTDSEPSPADIAQASAGYSVNGGAGDGPRRRHNPRQACRVGGQQPSQAGSESEGEGQYEGGDGANSSTEEDELSESDHEKAD